jgi:uncharacterized membrane protein YbaN (DUF454 family)
MTASPKQALRELEEAAPGTRFQRAYEKRHRSPHGRRKNAAFVIGGLLTIAFGVVTYPVPVIPSELVILIGLGLVAQGSRRGAVILDHAETRLRRWFAPALRVWKRWPKWAKIAAGIAWMALISSFSYWVYRTISD